MDIELLFQGEAFRIYALCRSRSGIDHCPALEYLDEISEPSRKSLLSLLKQHAERGPILNRGKSRPLGDGIFEFKSRQGGRILYFYPAGQRGDTILAHGFGKGSRLETEIARAKAQRAEYLQSFS